MPLATKVGKFSEGEKLLCYHGPLLYEAKCIKIKKESGNFMYLVHYQGWNKTWDEWVNDTRILKIIPENQERKQKLLKEHYAAMREKKKASKVAGTSGGPPFPKEGGKRSGGGSANTSRASTPVSERSFMIAPSLVSSTVTAAKRTLADDEISISSHEDHPVSRRLGKRTRLSDTMLDDTDSWKFRIEIPEELKYVLVSDGELVSQKKLFGLPAKMSVGTILSDYVKHVEKLQLDNIGAVSEVILGIKEFFNSTVCLQLLYKQEKPQYANKVAKENVAPSDIYGSPHLLRLMVKIGPLLNQSTIDATSESNVGLIENVIGDFLIYLEANRSRLFTSKNYTESVDEYDSVKDSQI